MPTDIAAAVVVTDIKKTLGDVVAVNGVSFTVAPGEIVSLLGPNGAGKTTTFSMICGLLRPDAGHVSVCGYSLVDDPLSAKAELGVVPQNLAIYEDLSTRENLVFFAKMYGLASRRLAARVDDVLEVIGLVDRAKERVGTFSGGMKRRLNLGIALLHEPKVVLMDEPTVGIDPQSRRHILDGVKALNARGTSVLYSTHYMEEAEALSDRVVILDHGVVVDSGTPAELKMRVGEHARVTLVVDGDDAARDRAAIAFRGLDAVARVDVDADIVVLTTDADRLLPQLLGVAVDSHLRVRSVSVDAPDLESVFLQLTGRRLRD
jgi:ABC-2 type transport system ATP-binding protein